MKLKNSFYILFVHLLFSVSLNLSCRDEVVNLRTTRDIKQVDDRVKSDEDEVGASADPNKNGKFKLGFVPPQLFIQESLVVSWTNDLGLINAVVQLSDHQKCEGIIHREKATNANQIKIEKLKAGIYYVCVFAENREGNKVGAANNGIQVNVGEEIVISDLLLASDVAKAKIYTDAKNGVINPIALRFRPQYKSWANGLVQNSWLVLPRNEKINNEKADWTFPKGTIAIYELSEQSRRVETRILVKVKEPEGIDAWESRVFAWKSDGTNAARITNESSYILANGTEYRFVDESTCSSCHKGARDGLISFSSLQLTDTSKTAEEPDLWNYSKLAQRNFFTHEVLSNSIPTIKLGLESDKRIVEYLHANCAHCHSNRSTASAFATGLILGVFEGTLTNINEANFFRTAVNVNNRIVPGNPNSSSLVSRMESASSPMPPVGQSVPNRDGIDMLRKWITQLDLPSPIPTSTPGASTSPQPTQTPKPTASPTPKPTASPTPKPTASPTPKATVTPSPTPVKTPAPDPIATYRSNLEKIRVTPTELVTLGSFGLLNPIDSISAPENYFNRPSYFGKNYPKIDPTIDFIMMFQEPKSVDAVNQTVTFLTGGPGSYIASKVNFEDNFQIGAEFYGKVQFLSEWKHYPNKNIPLVLSKTLFEQQKSWLLEKWIAVDAAFPAPYTTMVSEYFSPKEMFKPTPISRATEFNPVPIPNFPLRSGKGVNASGYVTCVVAFTKPRTDILTISWLANYLPRFVNDKFVVESNIIALDMGNLFVNEARGNATSFLQKPEFLMRKCAAFGGNFGFGRLDPETSALSALYIGDTLVSQLANGAFGGYTPNARGSGGDGLIPRKAMVNLTDGTLRLANYGESPMQGESLVASIAADLSDYLIRMYQRVLLKDEFGEEAQRYLSVLMNTPGAMTNQSARIRATRMFVAEHQGEIDNLIGSGARDEKVNRVFDRIFGKQLFPQMRTQFNSGVFAADGLREVVAKVLASQSFFDAQGLAPSCIFGADGVTAQVGSFAVAPLSKAVTVKLDFGFAGELEATEKSLRIDGATVPMFQPGVVFANGLKSSMRFSARVGIPDFIRSRTIERETLNRQNTCSMELVGYASDLWLDPATTRQWRYAGMNSVDCSTLGKDWTVPTIDEYLIAWKNGLTTNPSFGAVFTQNSERWSMVVVDGKGSFKFMIDEFDYNRESSGYHLVCFKK